MNAIAADAFNVVLQLHRSFFKSNPPATVPPAAPEILSFSLRAKEMFMLLLETDILQPEITSRPTK